MDSGTLWKHDVVLAIERPDQNPTAGKNKMTWPYRCAGCVR
jgi:hypothetical protein